MKPSYWLAAACLAASVPAYANTGFKPIEIKDQELSELRGRYTMPGRIISFGVVMSSSWRNASGELIGATTTLQIQASTVKPEFYVSIVKEAGNGNPVQPGSGNVIGGSGLGSSQGVTQSVRAAGDGNTAYNKVTINVKEGSQAPAQPNSGQLLSNGQSISDHNGAGSVVVSTQGGMKMSIQASNNQGNSLQQVAQGGLLQNTQLLGSSNVVNNMTQLNVVLNNNGPSTGAVDCNLSQLKGLRNLGY